MALIKTGKNEIYEKTVMLAAMSRHRSYRIMDQFMINIFFILTLIFISANASFGFPSCPTEYDVETWTNCRGILLQSNGNEYEGEWEDGKASGNGTFIFAEDTCIKGICFPAGLKYKGKFRNGAANGYGIAWYPNGIVKEGIWGNNIFQFTTYKALLNSFLSLTLEDRTLVQSRLKKIGLYPSKVDGLFGSKTSKALTAYNSKYLQSLDLSKSKNTDSLLAAILYYEDTKKIAEVKNINPLSEIGDSKICTLATKSKDGNLIWNDNYFAKKYIKEARRRGVSCGLIESGTLKNMASDSKLCQLATRKTAKGNVWNKNQYASVHVKTAQTKGLKCGVVEFFPEKPKGDPTILSNAKVCLLATKKSEGQVIWNSQQVAAPHIAQAEIRALDCGVRLEEAEAENPKSYQSGIEAYKNGNFKSAMEQAKILAPLGNADAQFYLGKMYAEGKGTLQRNTHAHMWFNLASANGHSEAAQERDVLAGKMTPVLVDKAQDLAAACMDSDYQDCALGKKLQPKNQDTNNIKYTENNKALIKASFREGTLLRRKQIQFALRKLGYYTSSIDGLWGKKTERAVVNFGKDQKLGPNNPSEIFASVLNKVDVPTSFAVAKPKKKPVVKISPPPPNSYGLTAIVSNPSLPADQAYSVCKPQARMAESQAGRERDSSNNFVRCSRSSFGSFSCNDILSGGGKWAGALAAFDRVKREARAYNATLDACLAGYGWRD